ncbi:hypothetical protein B6V01_002410 [Methanosarcinales archaeon ex4572_44]|nr:MAG: hypothetical protein B6U67_02335 [Methanosarcinales archaeon ex4484_138]PHP45773.1 MAG: hypothetical protein B6V01_002410 [Methanosarcinales archaeon ex4572_44]
MRVETNPIKLWHTKEWKEQRDKIINDCSVCELCGSKENLVIHHPNSKNRETTKKEVWQDFYGWFCDNYSKMYPTKEEIKTHSTRRQHKHRSHDYWHDPKVKHKLNTDNSDLSERNKLSDEFIDYDKKRWQKMWDKAKQQNKDIIKSAIGEITAIENKKYMDFEDIQILCKRCHWATHNGMDLCPVCKQKYKKKQYKTCFDCLPGDAKKQISDDIEDTIELEKHDFAIKVLCDIPEFCEDSKDDSNFVEKEYGGSPVKALSRYGLEIGERIEFGRFQIKKINK